MIYAITAKLVSDRCGEFHLKLTDGTISGLRPDGSEIVASMARARIDDGGSVRWTETCYCRTPLAHERETVLDRYFSDIETKLVDGHAEFDGEPLMDRLSAG
jgi:hypothetical protein